MNCVNCGGKLIELFYSKSCINDCSKILQTRWVFLANNSAFDGHPFAAWASKKDAIDYINEVYDIKVGSFIEVDLNQNNINFIEYQLNDRKVKYVSIKMFASKEDYNEAPVAVKRQLCGWPTF